MNRHRQMLRTTASLIVLAGYAVATQAAEPAGSPIAADPMYMAVYGGDGQVASIGTADALPAFQPAPDGTDRHDHDDFALNDAARGNPFQVRGTKD
jgi:hypothetical protein